MSLGLIAATRIMLSCASTTGLAAARGFGPWTDTNITARTQQREMGVLRRRLGKAEATIDALRTELARLTNDPAAARAGTAAC